jgi:hypothetical protein
MFSPRTPPSLRSDKGHSRFPHQKIQGKKTSFDGHRKAKSENDIEIHCNSTDYNYIY